MKKKGKLWYADWRDAAGVRHRKGFKTAAQAREYATRMQRRESAKKAQASGQSL